MRIPFIRPKYCSDTCQPFDESGCLGLQPKTGGRSHLKLNILGRPIAKKYSDGKVKRTLKRRSKVLETVKRETDGASNYPMGAQIIRAAWRVAVVHPMTLVWVERRLSYHVVLSGLRVCQHQVWERNILREEGRLDTSDCLDLWRAPAPNLRSNRKHVL